MRPIVPPNTAPAVCAPGSFTVTILTAVILPYVTMEWGMGALDWCAHPQQYTAIDATAAINVALRVLLNIRLLRL
jgi:hypothetical protein